MVARFPLALATLLALVGCVTADPVVDEGPLVLAAASLADTLPAVAPDARYAFDGSAALLDQMLAGAPADVFVAADEATMQRAVVAGLVEGEPVPFASNHLVLVVPADNPAGVTGFDASLESVKLVVCARSVPCGAQVVDLAQQHALALAPVSEETKVTDVLGKVSSGEADAGLVYATDAAGQPGVRVLPIDGAERHLNTYWVAVVAGTTHAKGASAFVDNLMGPGQELLRAAGFGAPA